MNRAQTQNDDLRKMQQEAMRRVQEMQNKSQGYMRTQSGYNSIYNVPNEQEAVKRDEHEPEKQREKNRQGKQRTRTTPPMAQIPPVAPGNTQYAEDADDCCEPECSCEQQPICDNEQPMQCCDREQLNSKTDFQTDNGNNSDLILIIAVILILNGNKNNYALMLALLYLLI